jgi:hypothetical protein
MHSIQVDEVKAGSTVVLTNKRIKVIEAFPTVNSDSYFTLITDQGPIDVPKDWHVMVVD